MDNIQPPNEIKWKLRFSVKVFLFLLLCVLFFVTLWAILTYDNVSLAEVVFHIHVPLKGTGGGIALKGTLSTVIPSIVLTLLFAFLIYPRQSKVKPSKPIFREFRGRKWIARALAIAVFVSFLLMAQLNLNFLSYVRAQFTYTDFLETHYKDPNNVGLKAPDKKRNLVFIYLESMESTFADIESGGNMQGVNRIPHLTELAKQHASFSHHDKPVGGFRNSVGTSWTVGAAFGATTGLPLCVPISRNAMSKLKTFFPGATALGDILEKDGYHNVLMADGETTFGGQKRLFEKHGNYEVLDYTWAHENGKIPKGYFKFWGFEDYRLYEFAKEKLTSLSQSGKPFNLTLFTLDTHFEDGLVCPKCKNDFDDQYSRVIACADRQVNDFVEWIQKQDFYENTTIVIVGDHLTMDIDYCADIDREDRAVYNCIINAAVQPTNTRNREFMITDMFPTTLAAMGYTFEGSRLGLGTNMFSSDKTLCEQYGTIELDKHFSQRSEFYENELLYGRKR